MTSLNLGKEGDTKNIFQSLRIGEKNEKENSQAYQSQFLSNMLFLIVCK